MKINNLSLKIILSTLFVMGIQNASFAYEYTLTPEEMFEKALAHSAGYNIDQDLELSYKLYKQASESGHTLATTNLAHHYYLGAGVERDIAKSIELFKSACMKSEPFACKALGAIYAVGEYVKPDPHASFNYYQLSANNGDVDSLLSQADLIFKNKQLAQEKGVQTGIQLLTKSALKGYPPAVYKLGLIHYYGEHIDQDLVTALAWINIAVNMGEENAVQAKPMVEQYLDKYQRDSAYEMAKSIRDLHFKGMFQETNPFR